ncbi:Centrosomal protein cep57L1 [Chytridiales sp. JEL 0842]|nr:Centrosomal protein cep57L1 [Chytridiales sp. JEL 0842]
MSSDSETSPVVEKEVVGAVQERVASNMYMTFVPTHDSIKSQQPSTKDSRPTLTPHYSGEALSKANSKHASRNTSPSRRLEMPLSPTAEAAKIASRTTSTSPRRFDNNEPSIFNEELDLYGSTDDSEYGPRGRSKLHSNSPKAAQFATVSMDSMTSSFRQNEFAAGSFSANGAGIPIPTSNTFRPSASVPIPTDHESDRLRDTFSTSKGSRQPSSKPPAIPIERSNLHHLSSSRSQNFPIPTPSPGLSMSATSATSRIFTQSPNLAEAAHMKGSRSGMSLHEQGALIVPSVVDKVDPEVRHRSLSHLPEDGNSRAVVSALRTLQEKVVQLEKEKANAKSKIVDLEDDLSKTRQMLFHTQNQNTFLKSTSSSTATTGVSPTKEAATSMSTARLARTEKEINTSTSLMHDVGLQVNPNGSLAYIPPPSTSNDASAQTAASTSFSFNRQPSELQSNTQHVPVSTKETHPSWTSNTHHHKGSDPMENHLVYLQTRASILEKQLDRARGLQHSTAEELRGAKRELLDLRAKIRKQEREIKEKSGGGEKEGVYENGWMAESERSSPEPRRVGKAEGGGHSYAKAGSQRSSKRIPDVSEVVNDNDVDESFIRRDEIDILRAEIEAMRRKKDVSILISPKRKMDSSPKKSVVVRPPPSIARPKSAQELPKKSQPDYNYPVWKKVDNGRPLSRAPSAPTRSKSPVKDRHESGFVDLASLKTAPEDLNQSKSLEIQVVKAREMPFVVGKSTNRSHSVTANLQRVFALLKAHNPALCSVCSKRKSAACDVDCGVSGGEVEPSINESSPSVASETEAPLPNIERVSMEDDHAGHHKLIAEEGSDTDGTAKMKKVLSLLEDEFDAYKRLYQDLVRTYNALTDQTRQGSASNTHVELRKIGDELREVIQNMEIKGDQIAIIRDILASSAKVQQHLQQASKPSENAKVEDTSTSKPNQKTSQKKTRSRQPSTEPQSRPQPSKSTAKASSNAKMEAASRQFRASTGSIMGQVRGRNAAGLHASLSKRPAQPPSRRSTIPRAAGGLASESVPRSKGRGTSVSPSRVLASLTLLKSSQKVQDALEENLK